MLLPIGERLAGRADDFQSAGDAGGVGGSEAGSGFRIFASMSGTGAMPSSRVRR
jgi:hypothetical protein